MISFIQTLAFGHQAHFYSPTEDSGIHIVAEVGVGMGVAMFFMV